METTESIKEDSDGAEICVLPLGCAEARRWLWRGLDDADLISRDRICRCSDSRVPSGRWRCECNYERISGCRLGLRQMWRVSARDCPLVFILEAKVAEHVTREG